MSFCQVSALFSLSEREREGGREGGREGERERERERGERERERERKRELKLVGSSPEAPGEVAAHAW